MAKNILVIDDDGLVAKSLCNLLKKSDYSAEALGDGFEALEAIANTHFDLIIVDIKMPGIDGVETAKRIKELLKRKNRPDIPVIFITGYSELSEKAKSLGKVFLKPFDNEEILKTVKEHLFGNS
ncbi:MAG: response regulator [Candidatus Omnitrophica bacterium]|nr:response regulator [Candidatus Omnitrophota bacterium]